MAVTAKFVQPMAALNTAKLPEGDQWLCEVKWDGYRALALKRGDSLRLLSRKGNDLTRDYPEVVEALQSIKAKTALLDGEIVALDDHGRPSFQMLQHRGSLGRIAPSSITLSICSTRRSGSKPSALEKRK